MENKEAKGKKSQKHDKTLNRNTDSWFFLSQGYYIFIKNQATGTLSVMRNLQLIFKFFKWIQHFFPYGMTALLIYCSIGAVLCGIFVRLCHDNVASIMSALTKCCVISTAIGVTSSLYSQIIFCMTLVRSSFSVSLTMCRSACITGRMKGVMYSLAKNDTRKMLLDGNWTLVF